MPKTPLFTPSISPQTSGNAPKKHDAAVQRAHFLEKTQLPFISPAQLSADWQYWGGAWQLLRAKEILWEVLFATSARMWKKCRFSYLKVI